MKKFEAKKDIPTRVLITLPFALTSVDDRFTLYFWAMAIEVYGAKDHQISHSIGAKRQTRASEIDSEAM